MRVSNKDLEKITELSDRTIGDGKSILESDLRIAVLHVRWLASLQPDRAESWGRFYSRLFKKIGIDFPAVGKDLRAITSVQTVKAAQASPNVGRPSNRPSYCTQPLAVECGRCAARWGRWWDCTGRPVSGSWGVSVVNPLNGDEVRTAKPADGKRVRGCYFSGGVVYKDGKKTIVPRGVSVGHSGVQ